MCACVSECVYVRVRVYVRVCVRVRPSADKVVACKAPHFPKDESRGFRLVNLTQTIFIERDDFREQDSKGFYGLSVGKEVHLKYGFNIQCTRVAKDAAGNVTELFCTVDETNATKVKGNLHWVPANSLTAEVRFYDHLFMSENPMEFKGDWLADVNTKSETVGGVQVVVVVLVVVMVVVWVSGLVNCWCIVFV